MTSRGKRRRQTFRRDIKKKEKRRSRTKKEVSEGGKKKVRLSRTAGVRTSVIKNYTPKCRSNLRSYAGGTQFEVGLSGAQKGAGRTGAPPLDSPIFQGPPWGENRKGEQRLEKRLRDSSFEN